MNVNFTQIFSFISNGLHFMFIFSPICFFFFKQEFIRPVVKYMMLPLMLTPLHWEFFSNKCISTIVTDKVSGDFYDSKTTSGFSEKYMGWLYKPLMDHVFKLEWNEFGINRMVYIHWIFNFMLMWYYTFFIYNS